MKQRPRILERIMNSPTVTEEDRKRRALWDRFKEITNHETGLKYMLEVEDFASRIKAPSVCDGTKSLDTEPGEEQAQATPEQEEAIKHFITALLQGFFLNPLEFFSDSDKRIGFRLSWYRKLLLKWCIVRGRKT